MGTSVTRLVVALGVAALVASSAGIAGCSGVNGATGGPDGGAGETTGSVGVQLTVPGGVIDRVDWSIHGPNAYAGIVRVSGASTVSFVVPGVAPGSGYTIALTAMTMDGSARCEGSSLPFAITENQVTEVNVLLTCTTTSESGAVVVNGSTYDCATWHTAVANPAKTTVGGTVTLVAYATGPDPDAVTYHWSTTAGAVANPTAASTTFTCPASAGEYVVTLVVADGAVPDGGACRLDASETSLTVRCEEPMDGGAEGAASRAASSAATMAWTTTAMDEPIAKIRPAPIRCAPISPMRNHPELPER